MIEPHARIDEDAEPSLSRNQLIQSGLILLSERTLVSLARTSVYGILAGFFAFHGSTQVLDAAILGAVLADFITWTVRSLLELPENLLHGGYDAAVNLAFASFFFRVANFEITDDGSSVAVAFMTFMLVLGVKVGYYALQRIQATLTQD